MSKHKRTRDGRYVDDVAAEGERIAVSLMMCDSHPRRWPGYAVPLSAGEAALLRPGFRLADAATRDSVTSARNEMIARSHSAWMDGKRRREPPDDDDDDDDLDRENRDRQSVARNQAPRLNSLADIRRPAIEAREAMIRRMQDAWKSPARSLAASRQTRQNRPVARMRGILRAMLPPVPVLPPL
jgi:hypothetical protein